MSLDRLVALLFKYCQTHESLFPIGSREHGLVSLWVEGTKATWIIAGVNRIDQAQVSEVVHINSVLEHDHNPKE